MKRQGRPALGQIVQRKPFRKHGQRSTPYVSDEIAQNFCAVRICVVEPPARRFDGKRFQRVAMALLGQIVTAEKRDQRNPPDRAAAELQVLEQDVSDQRVRRHDERKPVPDRRNAERNSKRRGDRKRGESQQDRIATPKCLHQRHELQQAPGAEKCMACQENADDDHRRNRDLRPH